MMKFMRRHPPNILVQTAHDGAGRQSARRAECNESADGPRHSFTVPSPQPAEEPSRGPDLDPAGGYLSLLDDLTRADMHPIAMPHYGRRGFRAAKVETRVNPFDQLAYLLRTLSWEQMMVLGAEIAGTGDGGPITREELPAALHLWAMKSV